MSDFSQVEGSWLACDGNWYPPQSLTDWRREHLSDSTQPQGDTSEPIPVPALTEPNAPESPTSKAFGWWHSSDRIWTHDQIEARRPPPGT